MNEKFVYEVGNNKKVQLTPVVDWSVNITLGRLNVTVCVSRLITFISLYVCHNLRFCGKLIQGYHDVGPYPTSTDN
jgi:hypothetical protein